MIRAIFAPSVGKHVFVPRGWTVFTFNGDTYRQRVPGIIEVKVGTRWVQKLSVPMAVLSTGRIVPGEDTSTADDIAQRSEARA